MKKKLIKAAVRMAAPELDISRKAMRKTATKAGKWAMKRVTRRQEPDYGAMALKGLGAAAHERFCVSRSHRVCQRRPEQRKLTRPTMRTMAGQYSMGRRFDSFWLREEP